LHFVSEQQLELRTQKHTNYFLSYRLQNQADCDKILHLLSYATDLFYIFPPHLNNASTLPYETSCFCENSNAGKAKLKILLVDFDFTYQNRPRFEKDDKKFWRVFRFTVLTAVHLQNANAKFHKVEGRDTIQVKQKTFTFLYDKFTEDNMY